MNLKLSLILCLSVVMMMPGGLDAKKGGKGMAKSLCRIFGEESTGDGTVTEYCEQIGNDIKALYESIEGKMTEIKETIQQVCADGDFEANTKKGRICAKINAEE